MIISSHLTLSYLWIIMNQLTCRNVKKCKKWFDSSPPSRRLFKLLRLFAVAREVPVASRRTKPTRLPELLRRATNYSALSAPLSPHMKATLKGYVKSRTLNNVLCGVLRNWTYPCVCNFPNIHRQRNNITDAVGRTSSGTTQPYASFPPILRCLSSSL